MTQTERESAEFWLAYWRKQIRNLTSIAIGYVSHGGGVPFVVTHETWRAHRAILEIQESGLVTRTMYDSTDPNAIPEGAEIVAYYPHAWGSDMSKHSAALQLRIDNRGDHADDCHVLDVESGAASNATASEWVQSWHKLHPDGMHAANGYIGQPILYTSTSNLPALRAACHGLTYNTWAAQWDGTQTPIAGCFARQYADHGPNGEHYDMSLVYDDTFGKAPEPVKTPPPPPPAPHPATLAALLVWGTGNDTCSWREVHSTDGGHSWQ